MTSLIATAVPAFLASLVEFVEALTIVLAVGATRGWRSAAAGTVAAVLALVVTVLLFGPALGRIPVATLQLVVGVPLVFFGLRWLRKAILRYAGVLPMHDEAAIYAKERNALAKKGARRGGIDALGFSTAFQAVALEGLEVAFIVIALGATAGAIAAASVGAAAAGIVVVGCGVALRQPLSRIPENTLKFVAGLMLSSFGTFWTGEGLRVAWPGGDAALGILLAAFGVAAVAAYLLARRAVASGSGRPARAPS